MFPSFFHDETESALISRVAWLENEAGVSDAFFSHMLKIDQKTFSRWKNKEGVLSEEPRANLQEFWQATLHILSLFNFDSERLRNMLEQYAEKQEWKTPLDPPWTGTSLREYLESQGPSSIKKVSQWAEAIRFAQSY